MSFLLGLCKIKLSKEAKDELTAGHCCQIFASLVQYNGRGTGLPLHGNSGAFHCTFIN